MGGIEWEALPTVAEILGIDDTEMLIYQLTVIRDHERPEE